MGKIHNPRRGSMGFYPRKRSRSVVPHTKAWAEDGSTPKLQAFAGYKAGMTHAMVIDYRPNSTTSGQQVVMPVTVVETPAMTIAAVRAYESGAYGDRTLTEVWADKLPARLGQRLPLPKKQDADAKWKLMDDAELSDVRVLAITAPGAVSGVDSKTPEVMEIRIGGGDMAARIAFGKDLLGKEVQAADVLKTGQMTDIQGVTKAFGFESRVVRFGTMLLSHKNSKHRRMIGTQGSWHPAFVQSTVPNDGQRGFHHRTEYNKRVLRVGDDVAEINQNGGFMHYGEVRNPFLLIHGSIPGPSKRLVKVRDAVRYSKGVAVDEPTIEYISTSSKQGGRNQ
jgi:large subunit ribosomal protein L3